jgi:energy-coupling factor transporter ATP-binding protein EcfA2
VSERVGIVFQFPERYFVADTVLDEVTFGWPRQKSSDQLRENLALGLQRAINWVGLSGIPLDKNPHSLSGGYKRRLALAIQLVQIPDLLILDEPLAGLDCPNVNLESSQRLLLSSPASSFIAFSFFTNFFRFTLRF